VFFNSLFLKSDNQEKGKCFKRFSGATVMLNYIITFFILAVIAAVFGFGGLASSFAGIAKFLAVVFIVLFIASLIYSMVTGKSANPPL
jgi:uncharacterized membrane protein YtjA (UPF0391 family)